MKDPKNTVTTIAAIISVVIGAVNAYLQSQTGPINWPQLALFVVAAITAYFTGKTPSGASKTPEQVVAANNPTPVTAPTTTAEVKAEAK